MRTIRAQPINKYKILTNNYIRPHTHKCKQIEYELWVPQSGTYIMKPTASCEAAPLWVRAIVPAHIVPRRGTDASRMMLMMIVGPALRNQERVR